MPRSWPSAASASSLEDFNEALEQGKVDTLNLILKGDVSGSVEALEDALLKIDVGDEVELRIIHRGVGAITQNDVNLATVDNAIIIGFNVRPAERVARAGRPRGRRHALLLGHLPGDRRRRGSAQGHAQAGVRRGPAGHAPRSARCSESSKFGNIAGSLVRSGEIRAERQGAGHPRRRRRRRGPRDRPSASLQGRRHRGPRGLRVRYRPRQRSTTSRSTTSSRRSRCARSRAPDALRSRRGAGSPSGGSAPSPCPAGSDACRGW